MFFVFVRTRRKEAKIVRRAADECANIWKPLENRNLGKAFVSIASK